MDSEHRTLLRQNRVAFANDLVLEELLQILVGKNLFSDRMVEAIQSKSTSFDRNVEFMNKLPTRGPRAFAAFYEALIDTDQHHLAKLLDPRQELNTSAEFTSGLSLTPSTFTFHESTPKKPSSSSFDTSGTHVTTPKTLKNPYVKDTSPNSGKEPEVMTRAHLPVEHMDIVEIDKQFHPRSKITVPIDIDELHSCTPLEELQYAAGLTQRTSNQRNSKVSSSVSTNHIYRSNTSTAESNKSLVVTDAPMWQNVQVRPCKREFFLRHQDNCYPMSKRTKGVALLISVTQFEPSACLDNRKGGEKDCASLEIMFRQLSYDCYRLDNGNAYEIRNTLKNFSLWPKLADYDSCFIVLMSHGENGVVFGRDGQAVNLEEMYSFYSNENCLPLQNKPKIFLIQACRGEDPDKGTDQFDAPTSNQKTQRSSKRLLNFEEPLRNKLPRISDCLFAYATVSGFAAMRNTERGSWFIQAFIQIVAFHALDKSLLEILTITNNQVKGREGYSPDSEFHRCKEMPEFTSCLCRPFYFFPGIHLE